MALAIAYAEVASALSGGLALAGQGRFAGWTLALGLPRSPVGAIAFLLVVLFITYAFVTTFIKVSVPSRHHETREASEDEPIEEEAREGTDEWPDPDWDERAGPNIYGPAEGSASAPELAPLEVESIRVRGITISVGDTAAEVMRAFKPGEGEMSPLVERDAAGYASEVTRTYRVGRQRITLILQRPEPDTPMRLTRIVVSD